MTGWFLEQLEIEGFRGINNEGAALVLKFKTDKVNSVSAPNAVGKSSIFDALTYALTGSIPKLDDLPAAENGRSYYLNRFHQAGVGTIKLTLSPDDGGKRVTVTVTRAADGTRTTTGSPGVNADDILAALNREFVLLDANTFHSFIARTSLDRGRNFAGLLGLSGYSALRQGLQSLANTRAFNNHFGTNVHKAARLTAERRVQQLSAAASADYRALVKEELGPETPRADAQNRAHRSLAQIALLSAHCVNRAFQNIDIDECTAAIRAKEAGPDRQRLIELIREQELWAKAVRAEPAAEDILRLQALAAERDAGWPSPRATCYASFIG